ncbi:MAG: hypothetical protein AAFX99_36275, partial [Myxococcota bacterium]
EPGATVVLTRESYKGHFTVRTGITVDGKGATLTGSDGSAVSLWQARVSPNTHAITPPTKRPIPPQGGRDTEPRWTAAPQRSAADRPPAHPHCSPYNEGEDGSTTRALAVGGGDARSRVTCAMI